jgi:hypothetical protein
LHEKIEEWLRKERESSNEWKCRVDDWTLREKAYEELKQQLLNEREHLKKQISIISVASDFFSEKRRDIENTYQGH